MFFDKFGQLRPYQILEGDGGNGGSGGSDDGKGGEPGKADLLPGAMGNEDPPAKVDPPPGSEPGKPGLMRGSESGKEDLKPGDPGYKEPDSGDTERPEHIPIKFWDEAKKEIRTEAMAKSYGDLEKEYGKLKAGKGEVAPETAGAYLTDFKMPTGTIGEGENIQSLDRIAAFDNEDPALKVFAASSKEAGVTQKQFDIQLKGFLFGVNSFMPEPYDEAKEMQALGGEVKAKALIDTNERWLDRLVTTKTLDAGQKDFLLDFAGTAKGISALNALRMETGEKPIPTDTALNMGGGRKTRQDLQAMRNDPRFNSKDEVEKEAYRKEVEQAYKDNDIQQ